MQQDPWASIPDLQENDPWASIADDVPQQDNRSFIGKALDWLNEPTSKLPGVAVDLFSAVNYPNAPELIKTAGRNLANDMTSPFNIGSALLTGGGSLAGRAGYAGIGTGLKLAADAPLIGGGLYDIFSGNPVSGAIETGLGALGVGGSLFKRGAKSVGSVVDNGAFEVLDPVPAGSRALPPRTLETIDVFADDVLPPRQLNAPESGIRGMLPAQGETSITSDPRFYAGARGISDELADYPGTTSPRPMQMVKDPKTGAFTRTATPNPVAAFDAPSDIVAESGMPFNRRTPKFSGGTQRLNEPVLEQPIGGRIVEPPSRAADSGIAPFRKDTLTGNEADAFKGPITPEVVKAAYDANDFDVVNRALSSEIDWFNVKPIVDAVRNGSKITPGDLKTVVSNLPKLDNKAKSIAAELFNLPRAIMATDLSPISSSMFRQAAPLMHTGAWWNAWDDMVRAWGSEKAFQDTIQSIKTRPNFAMGERAGLKLTDLNDLTRREEAIASTWVERIPGFGSQVARRSNRGYTASLDKIRADVFDNLVQQAADSNRILDAKPTYSSKFARVLDPQKDMSLAEKIADYVNTASGRGSLGRFEKNAQELSIALFSPRRLASIVKMMDPRNYLTADPFIRKQYWKSLGSVIGSWGTFATIGALAGANINLTDPTNSDFGKIRIGNTRIDPGAGFLQQLVLMSRLASGETTSSVTGESSTLGSRFGGPTRLSVTGDWAANKLNPVVRYVYDWANASDYRPFDKSDRTMELFMPMAISDLLEVMMENPNLFPVSATALASAAGMGSQTY